MRFIVMLDLISTILQPVVVIYLGYIVYLLASNSDIVPITSLLLLAAIYGLQAVIFILRRRWEMVGYLIIYILAIPVYSFALPLHAFWNMDKFSWYARFRSQLIIGVLLVSHKVKEVKQSSSPTKVASIHAQFPNRNGKNTKQKCSCVTVTTMHRVKSQERPVNPCVQVCLFRLPTNEVDSPALWINRTSSIIHRVLTDHLAEVRSDGNHAWTI